MAENDINNEEQYKEAAKKLIKYYNENKEELKKVYNKKTKKYTFDEICNKKIVDKIYSDFTDSFSLNKLSLFNNQDILTRFLFQNGNKNDFFHQIEFNTKELGGIRGGTVYKYGIHKDESGWIYGYSEKINRVVDEQEALSEGNKIIKRLIDGGKVIEKYKNELVFIENYESLDKELDKVTSHFSTKTWVRKYYHMLFPEYFCNWFSDNKLSDVLTKLKIANQSKTYYGKCGQLMKIYKNTGLDNPVLVMFICVALLNIKNEDDENEDYEDRNDTNGAKNIESFPLNQILYGPPGTGKTYNTVIEALRIVEPKLIKAYENKEKTYDDIKAEFNRLKGEGKIEFITFHQSYAYEEFVEGIKPNLEDWGEATDKLTYKGEDGVFKKIAIRALFDRFEINKEIRDKIIDFEFIKDKFKEKYQIGIELETFKSQSKFKIEKYTENSLRIRPLNSEYVFSISFDYLEDAFNKNLETDEDIVNIIGMPKGLSTYYRSVYGKLKDIYNTEVKHKSESERKTVSNPEDIKNKNKPKLIKDYYNRKISLKENVNDSKPYVLIIDEINRGNISKIFGELITLIEEDKRESFSVRLPYSHEEFTVPKNLYIIGTMNTSDRSIASIDIALRRRFTFKEMMPDSELVADFGINFKKIFEELNNRIRILLDRDHQIGHSYFIKDKYENANIEKLKEIWFNSIMPLLNEYFYNDWDKLKLIIPGFIKSIDIPQNLKDECESAYEFKSFDEMKDDIVFIEALNQTDFKE